MATSQGQTFQTKPSVTCVNQRLRNSKRVLENLRCCWDGLENASQGKVSFSSRSRRQGTPVCLGKPSKGWKLVPECFAHGPLSLIRAACLYCSNHKGSKVHHQHYQRLEYKGYTFTPSNLDRTKK